VALAKEDFVGKLDRVSSGRVVLFLLGSHSSSGVERSDLVHRA